MYIYSVTLDEVREDVKFVSFNVAIPNLTVMDSGLLDLGTIVDLRIHLNSIGRLFGIMMLKFQ